LAELEQAGIGREIWRLREDDYPLRKRAIAALLVNALKSSRSLRGCRYPLSIRGSDCEGHSHIVERQLFACTRFKEIDKFYAEASRNSFQCLECRIGARVFEELKALHSAYSLCFSIINRGMALKRQQVRPMKQRHDEAVAAFQIHQQSGAGLLQLQLDLQTLSQLKFPGELLEKIVFEKCALGAKGLAAAISLTGAIDHLQNSIDYRNGLISDFRARNAAMTELERIQFYVGAPGQGHVDNRLSHNITALASQTDDCIFFGTVSADELLRRSDRLWKRSIWKYRLGLPRLRPVDWTAAREAGLLPNEAEYANWTSGFRRPETIWRRFGPWLRKACSAFYRRKSV
jgi:hypothetical protein